MNAVELDSRYTFDTYVVGSANRLASAAARRVAESPGSTYNPLFIYSASGLGKTHLVTAIGNHARRVLPELEIVYDTLEHFMEGVTAAIEAGERDAFRSRLGEIGLLILDDVQFLAGQPRMQEELLRAWDALTARGGQVVLTSDRPPQEIDALDDRLLSRFSGGLIVDIGAPDYETRVAIVRKKAEERGQTLGAGVAEALARTAFGNVRELQGALNRLFAVQELEGRAVEADEVERFLGAAPAEGDEFGTFLAEIAETVSTVVERSPAEQRLADAILRWEGEGYRTRRLERALADPTMHADVESVIRGYEADVERLREIAAEIDALEPDSPERVRRDVLRDPDRRDEAEALLGLVRERSRPLPAPPEAVDFDATGLAQDAFAVRAASAVAEEPGTRYNPLFLHGGTPMERTTLLAALGNRLAEKHPDLPLAWVDGRAFAAELIQALERNRVDGWRARYRRARVLLIDDLDALSDTERAQEELFHLFDLLLRSGGQIACTATCAPQELKGLEDRLRTRLGSGLVVDLSTAGDAGAADARGVGTTRAAEAGADEATERSGPDEWFRNREKLIWRWPYVEDWLVEELET